MQREYFCCSCGLFHWVDQYKTCTDTGRIDYIPHTRCSNEKCISHSESDTVIFAVDTYGYAYFAKSNAGFIKEMGWSSLKYATDEAIEIYKIQGVNIVE